MGETSEFEVPEGSVAAGRRVRLPAGAEPPFGVYVNGIRQAEGTQYEVEGTEIVFSRPIIREGELGKLRWLSMFLGLVGSYRKHETVDVEYRRGEGIELATDLEPIPD
jgi:hypothetical protein